jgi:hypothetical protein
VEWLGMEMIGRVVGSLGLFVCLKVPRCMMVIDVIDIGFGEYDHWMETTKVLFCS